MPIIKAGITSQGFRTAVRDYTPPSVVEEIAANSYDADATTVVVLLDGANDRLHIIDDGVGFTRAAIELAATLGGGAKTVPYSKGKRHYLGSYGYGLKSTLNIANSIEIDSVSAEGRFTLLVDWTNLDDALKQDFAGFPLQEKPRKSGSTGTRITLNLKHPTTKADLDRFGEALANLPSDDGKFCCFFGQYSDVAKHVPKILERFDSLSQTAKRLTKAGKLQPANSSVNADLSDCERSSLADSEHKVTAVYYFAGITNGKVKPLKTGLRGIYVRIHGRLLKQNFTDRRYTYAISKWVKFESGLRIELTVDWLRDQITLSREGVRFANPKLEEDFKSAVSRLASRFIQPQLKRLAMKNAREATKRERQRAELAAKRVRKQRSIMVPGLQDGFAFRPETDGELALVLAQGPVLAKVSRNYILIDYNDQAPFDCLLYDKVKRSYINTELEPTLADFVDHRTANGIDLLVTWTLGKWRMGARRKGQSGYYELTQAPAGGAGRYRLLEYATDRSKEPRRECAVVALDELLG